MNQKVKSLIIGFFVFYFCTLSADENKEKDPKKTQTIEVTDVKSSTSSKYGSTEKDLSGFTEVIDLTQIEKRYNSLPDILEKEAGLRIKRYGGLGSYSTLSIRGSNANQVQFYIDGVPLNNAQYGEINLAEFSTDQFQSIEIYKSGNPSGFGNSAIGGVVNLVTKKGSVKDMTKISANGGSLNTYNLKVLHSGKSKDDIHYNFFGQYEKSDQNYRFQSDNGTIFNLLDDKDQTRKNAQFKKANLTALVSEKLDKTNFTFLNDFHYIMHGLPGPSSNQTEKTKRENLRNTTAISTGTNELYLSNLNLNSRIFYTGGKTHIFDPLSEFNYGTPNSLANTQQYGFHIMPELYLLNYNQILRFNFGIERETYKRDRRDKFDETKDSSSRKFRNLSFVQVQDEIRFFKKRLVFTPTILHNSYIDRFNERDELYKNVNYFQKSYSKNEYPVYKIGMLAVLLESKDIEFAFKANAATERRIPNFLELYGERASILGNTSLRPERSKNYDMGFIFNSKWTNVQSKNTISFFEKNIVDMILLVPNSQFSLKPENIDAAQIRGAELVNKIILYKKYSLHSNYTYQKAINQSDVTYLKGKYLPLRPLHEWNGGISIPISDFEIGADAYFTGAVFKDRTNSYLHYQQARWIYNLYITYNLKTANQDQTYTQFSFTFEIKNIQDKRVFDIIGYPLPGRLYYFSASASF